MVCDPVILTSGPKPAMSHENCLNSQTLWKQLLMSLYVFHRYERAGVRVRQTCSVSPSAEENTLTDSLSDTWTATETEPRKPMAFIKRVCYVHCATETAGFGFVINEMLSAVLWSVFKGCVKCLFIVKHTSQ